MLSNCYVSCSVTAVCHAKCQLSIARLSSTASVASTASSTCIHVIATGLSPAGDRIVEIAMKDSASSQQYVTLVSCAPARIHWGAYKAHGISTRQSHEHGLPFKYVLAPSQRVLLSSFR